MIEVLTRASSGHASGERSPVIRLTSGFGTGPTRLAAFDAALREAGIANFNLILLSSVIPAGSELVDAGAAAEPRSPPIGDWGDRLYIVLADQRVDTEATKPGPGSAGSRPPTGGACSLSITAPPKRTFETRSKPACARWWPVATRRSRRRRCDCAAVCVPVSQRAPSLPRSTAQRAGMALGL
jgi:Pyruvoyl-dependent arginine decarboxylase (PvlArgDC)